MRAAITGMRMLSGHIRASIFAKQSAAQFAGQSAAYSATQSAGGEAICGEICSEILIGAGAYPPGVQMSKGTITAKGKA